MELKEFGEYMKYLRNDKKMTIRQLENASKVSNSYISQIEKGEKLPSPEILKKLSMPLGVDIFDLLEKAGHIPPGTKVDTMQEYNHSTERYLEILYKKALADPDSKIPTQIKNTLRSYISDIHEDDNFLTILSKIKAIDNLRTKEDLVSDLWLIADEVQRDDLEYLLQSEYLTYKGHRLNDSDRELLKSMLDRMFNTED